MTFFGEPDEEEFSIDHDEPFQPRWSRTVRWTAVLVIASFALAGLSSLVRWF